MFELYSYVTKATGLYDTQGYFYHILVLKTTNVLLKHKVSLNAKVKTNVSQRITHSIRLDNNLG